MKVSHLLSIDNDDDNKQPVIEILNASPPKIKHMRNRKDKTSIINFSKGANELTRECVEWLTGSKGRALVIWSCPIHATTYYYDFSGLQ